MLTLPGLVYAFKIVLRRPTVFLSLATLMALSTVVSIVVLSSEYPSTSQDLIASVLESGLGLSHSEGLTCEAIVEAGSLKLTVTVLALEGDSRLWSVLKLKPPGAGSALLGYWVAGSLGVKPGDTVTLTVDGVRVNVTVGGYYRVNSILDTMVILGGGIGSCTSPYDVGEHSPSEVMGALSTQLSESLTQWYTVSLAALAMASLVSSYKALRDLEAEIAKLEAQGLSRMHVLAALSVSTAALIFIGASYGLVIFDLIVSATSSYMGIYMPTPGVSWSFALKAIIAPATVSLMTSTLSGVISWRGS